VNAHQVLETPDTEMSPRLFVGVLAGMLLVLSALGLMREVLLEARSEFSFDLWAGFLSYLTHFLGMALSGLTLWWLRRTSGRSRTAPRTRESDSRSATRVQSATRLSGPIPVYHHASTSMTALLPPPGGSVDVMPAALLLMASYPDLRDNPGFLEEARHSDQLCQEVVARYGAVLGRLNDGTWWPDTAVAAGLAHTSVSRESWSAKHMSGTREVVTVSAPHILGVRVSDTGLRIRIARRPVEDLGAWESALPSLRNSFTAVGVDSALLSVEEDAVGNTVLSFNDGPR
jgi:hypothetical protein